MTFEVTILGCSSATPTSSRHPAVQVVKVNEQFYLIDCGEAAQIQLRRFKFRIQRIDHIFITHLHGDHYLGLPGLLGTMHLLGREKDLHIYSPEGLEEIIRIHHHYSQTKLNYKIFFHPLEEKKIFEDTHLSVYCFSMQHRIPCFGFLFQEKEKPRNIIPKKILEYNIPYQQIPRIKEGYDFITKESKVVPNSELTLPAHPTHLYAHCSDTLYNESYIGKIKNADLLYHEATFISEHEKRASETFHCTARQAATLALKSDVKKLLIGHYSARYKELEILLNEAKEIFWNTYLAIEGETHRL